MRQTPQVKEFIEKHNRPPRILFIGNIANNSYQNAKVLREVGYNCDVLCYDYYHATATPEWDDSNFTGTITNFEFPNWRKVDLHGFERPKWFVQGQYSLCHNYLIAYNNEKNIKAWFWWKMMALDRLYMSKSKKIRTQLNMLHVCALFLYIALQFLCGISRI